MSLYSHSYGLTAKSFPGALGKYELSHTHVLPHLVGYSQYFPVRENETMQYFILNDLLASTIYVSRKQFSRDPKDLVLFKNRTSLYLMVRTHARGVMIVEDKSVEIINIWMRRQDRIRHQILPSGMDYSYSKKPADYSAMILFVMIIHILFIVLLVLLRG